MSWKRIKKAAKRVGGKIQDKAKQYGRIAKPILTSMIPGAAMFGGGGGGEEDMGFRSTAAKRIQGTKKQAGAGQISFNEEVWE